MYARIIFFLKERCLLDWILLTALAWRAADHLPVLQSGFNLMLRCVRTIRCNEEETFQGYSL